MRVTAGSRHILDEAHLEQLPYGFLVFDARRSAGGWVELVEDRLTIAKGYAWDGAWFLPWTPAQWLRPTLVHHALYRLMREGQFHRDRRRDVDALLSRHLREHGVPVVLAGAVYLVARAFGAFLLRGGQGGGTSAEA